MDNPQTEEKKPEVSFTPEQQEMINLMVSNAVREKELEQQKNLELKKAEQDGDFKRQLELERTKASELEARLAERDRQTLLAEVALELRLPKELMSRLRGKDKAELLADGKALLKHLKPAEAPDFEVPKTQTEAKVSPEQMYKAYKATGKYSL